MECPVCNTDLEKSDLGKYGFVILDVCPQCQGAWFDKGELDRLDEAIWVDIEKHAFHDVEGDHKQVSCPKCKVVLDPISPSDEHELIIDRCPSCEGFWLDRGELDRIVEMAADIRAQIDKRMTWYVKPPDWSSLRWLVHSFRECYFGKR